MFQQELETLMKYLSAITAALIVLAPLGKSMAQAQPATGHCPPGLAKKNPPCIPPGQVGKNYRIGDRYENDGYWRSEDPARYGLPLLPPGESYYRVGDSFLRVDDDTRLVLELVEVLAGVSD